MLQKADVVCKCIRGRHGGVGPGPKGYRTEKRDSTQATGEVTEMVGDAISADSSSTDNVNTMKYLLKMQKRTIDYPTIPLLSTTPQPKRHRHLQQACAPSFSSCNVMW